MKFFLLRVESVLFIIGFLCSGPDNLAADSSAQKKPVFLYSRYYNAVGESRYLPDGTYKDILTRLRSDFDVRVHSQQLNALNLAGVDVLFIANPHKEH